jgi:hypothetical protein
MGSGSIHRHAQAFLTYARLGEMLKAIDSIHSERRLAAKSGG